MNAILITVIILGVLTLFCWLFKKSDTDWDLIGMEVASLVGIILSAIVLIVHIICLFSVKYDYGQFEAKRNAFEMTLNEARETGNQMEAASILRDVAQWNSELASRQYDNSTFVLGVYTDDRIETLKPIK
jgi:heme/copper-type cytochrome/quinol oxidase subunit 2